MATTSAPLTFHLLPLESGKFSLIETLFAPGPVALAPPPTTLLPEGHVATTLFVFDELDAVDASTRSSPLTPGWPFGPGKPRGPAGQPARQVQPAPWRAVPPLKSSLRSVPFFTWAEATALLASLSAVTASFLSFGVVTAPILI